MHIYRGIFAMEFYGNHTFDGRSPVNLLRFCKTPSSEQHQWMAASGHLYYNKKHIYIQHIFL